jgi:phosphate transport system substrate-binding protein
MKMRHWLLTTLLLVVALVITACGGTAATPTTAPAPTTAASEPTAETVAPTEETAVEPTAETGGEPMGGGMGEMLGLPAVDPLSVEGDIAIAGSSTVYPLTVAVVERFQEEGYAGNPTIDSVGTGGGFEAFCVTAETDVANASRPINAEEAAACEESGRPAIEFRVGTDALAVVVNPENPVTDVTLEQLAQIYSGEVTNWNEIDPAAGDLPIALYSPGTDSGTFDYFVEAVFEEDSEPILSAPSIQFSEDDNVLVQGVEGDVGGIGYFGYAYYTENADALKILSVDGVEPTAETAESNEYPLSRPLFIYSAASVLDEKPQVEAFITYYLSYVNEVITEVGYFPASDEALTEAADHLLNRTAVSMEMETEEGGEMAEGMYGLAVVDPLSVEGDIAIAGSSTVYPLTVAVVEQFQEEGYAGNPTIDSVGTGGGFEAFCVNAETDIANASRPINAEEAAACEESGRPAIEFRVGTDALAVVVNPENPVSEVTLEQLAQIYSGEVTNWNEIDPAAGDLPIALYSPGTDSGTFDYFVEVIFEEDSAPILAAPGIQFSEDDNVLVQGVEGDVGGIGYFGYAYYSENAGALKILTIEGVEATAETAESNEYPLSRPLFIYSAESVIDEKPQVEAFISYYLQNVNTIITEVGYFPASEEALQEAADNLTNRTAVAVEAEEEAPAEGVALDAIDPLSVEGDISIAGSSTVYPLTVAVVERFQEEGYAGNPTIDSVGTGGGFEAFCVTAETDIANASRPINEEEAAACEESGRPAIEFRVGTDALAVVLNPENPVTDLTLEQLAQIYSGEVTNWNEIDPAAGDLPIALYSPGTDSGTFDYFVEVIFEEDSAPILAAPGIQFSEDDNVLVQGVEGDVGGIGYFGYAYYSENAGALKIVSIEGVEPTAETAESNEYPLSRPLFIYSAAEVLAEKPQVAAFISYYLQVVNEVITEVGYFPASDAALAEAAQAWVDAQP